MAEPTQSELEAARAEIERLKAENAELAEHEGGGRSAAGWVRGTAVVVLMALGFLLTPPMALAVWSRNTLLNTDRYVETVAPLAENEAIISDVADAVTDAIFAQIDVEQLLQDNLPPELTFAAGPIASQVKSTTRDLVVKALENDRFEVLWREVNRQASASVVALLTGTDQSQVLQIKNGNLVLQLAPIVEDVKTRLSEQGLDFVDKLPAVTSSVDLPVANVEYIQDARQGAELLNTVAYVLPWLVLACFAGAIAAARRRRRAVVWASLLVAASALLMGVALAVGRGIYIDSMPSDIVSSESAAVVFDTLVRFLRNGLRVFFWFAVVIALIAAVTGPSTWARKVREGAGGLLTQGANKTGWTTGQVGTFTAANRRRLQIAAVVVFGTWLFLLDTPTPRSLLWLLIGLLVVVGAIQFLAATAPRVEDESSVEGDKQEVEV
jgi:hypothetical protein